MAVRKCYESTTLRSHGLVIPRSRITARPYGSEPYSRIGAKNKHFLFQSQFDFLHARVRVALPPNNSASLQHSNQLAALLNYHAADLAPAPNNSAPLRRRNQSHRPRRPDSPQARRPATPRACARGNDLMQHSRLAATLRVVARVRARVGPRGCESRTNP